MASSASGDTDSGVDVTTAVGAPVAVLALIAVVLRFWTRYFTRAGFRWDDWMILVALLGTIGTDAMVLAANSIDPNGAAAASRLDPNYEFTPADIEFTKINFIATVLYFTIAAATKLSILLMYSRLFSVDASFRRQLIAVGCIVVGYWIGTTVADLLNCRPIEWTWINNLEDPRYCFDYNIFWLASGITEACIDLLIIAMPVKLVVGLQMSRGKKIAVMIVFLIGIFVLASGIIKVVLSYNPGNRNPSFERTAVWTTVHTCTGIICACLPVCWPLFVRLTKVRPRNWPSVLSPRKAWHNYSGWYSIDRRNHPRSRAPESERITNDASNEYVLSTLNIGRPGVESSAASFNDDSIAGDQDIQPRQQHRDR